MNIYNTICVEFKYFALKYQDLDLNSSTTHLNTHLHVWGFSYSLNILTRQLCHPNSKTVTLSCHFKIEGKKMQIRLWIVIAIK